MSEDNCCGKCQAGCCPNEEYDDYDYDDVDTGQEYFDFDDEAESIKVAVSSVSDSEILIYDECQRFVPVYYLDIPSLIARLSKYYNFLNIKHTKINVKNPDDIKSNMNCELEVLLRFKTNPEVFHLKYFSEEEFFKNWLPINKAKILSCEVKNSNEKYNKQIKNILLGE